VRVNEGEKIELSGDTSYSSGAVTKILVVKLLPLTVKLLMAEGAPVVAVNPTRELGDVTMDGLIFCPFVAVIVKSSMLIFGLEPVVPFASPLW